jgi:hypothetical protein
MDLVSIVQFDDTARLTLHQANILSAPTNLSFRGRGTRFAPAACEGSQVAAQTPTSHIPNLVFMSDGGTCTNDVQMTHKRRQQPFRALNGSVRQTHGTDLELHVIAFGSGADTHQLQLIAGHRQRGEYTDVPTRCRSPISL